MATPTNLPAAFVSGAILTADQMNNLRGAFRVLQVVAATTTTQVLSSNTTPVDTTLTATITPQSTSSKILVCVQQNGLVKVTNDTSITLKLLKGATVLATIGDQIAATGSNATSIPGGIGYMHLDSPATISATTYKTQFFSTSGNASVGVQFTASTSSIVLMEISA